jgi:hypothetical protein
MRNKLSTAKTTQKKNVEAEKNLKVSIESFEIVCISKNSLSS